MVCEHTIDLSHGVRPAIHFLRANLNLRRTVESLVVCNPGSYTGRFMEDDMFNLFATMGRLPRLQTLIVHFDNMQLPVYILAKFLQEARHLQELGLFHATLSGNTKEFDSLEETLQQHTSLEGVSLVRCIRCMQRRRQYFEDDIDDDAATVVTEAATDEPVVIKKRIPRIFCGSRNLRRLWLQDCPDNHIVDLAKAIQQRDTQLKELAIVSCQMGDNGVASISQMLQATTDLEELRLTLFRSHFIQVAESVAANSTIKKLTCNMIVPHAKPSLLIDGPKRI